MSFRMKILMKTPPCSLKRAGKLLPLVALASALFHPAAQGANVTWNGATSGSWAAGASWIGGIAPQDDKTSDDVYFDSDGDYTVSLTADRSVRRVYLSGSANPVFALGSHTLTLGSLFYVRGGSASLTSGSISVTQWYHGNRYSNSTFTLDGNTASVTTTAGNSHVGYSDSTQNSNTNSLLITNGASFTTAAAFNVGWVGSGAGANATANGNKIEVTGAGSTLTVNGSGISLGMVQDAANTGRAANNNSLVINAGGLVSTELLYVGRQLSSAAGSGAATGNTVTIGGSGTGSVLNLRTSENSSSLQIGNTISGGDVATNNVVAVNAGGAINANGSNLRVYGGTGNKLRVFGGAINSAGTILIQGGGGKLYLGAGGSITADTITVEAGGRFGDKSDAANAGFTSGTLNVTTMTYRPTVAFSIGDNSGTTRAIYQMAGNGVHSFGGGVVVEQSEGSLTGNGTIQGISGANTTLTVNGEIAPGNSIGTINVTGDLLSGPNAVFNFEIAGVSSFDQLNISGIAQFGGILNVVFLDDYAPDIGDRFDLFDFATSSGSFTLNLADLGEGKLWDISGLYTNGTLEVVPEPSALVLLGISVVGLGLRLRRRRG